MIKSKVYSFSTSRKSDIELLEYLKWKCRREGEKFSELVMKALRDNYEIGEDYATKQRRTTN